MDIVAANIHRAFTIYTRQWTKHFTYTGYLTFVETLEDRYFYAHFIDEETDTYRN